jgi:putative oxidoreductase
MNSLFGKIFSPGINSFATSLALLLLRVWIGLQMLLLHGLDKLKHFSEQSSSFPDPLGVGHSASLAMVIFAEVFMSVLLAVGLLTRFAALVLAFDMTMAFISVHQGALSGKTSGELAFLYLMTYSTLLLAGAGGFSFDRALFGKKSAA